MIKNKPNRFTKPVRFDSFMKYFWIFILLNTWLLSLFAQSSFPPAAGQPGSTAIYKDSSIIKIWAAKCIFQRGFINISDTTVTYNGSNKPGIGSDTSTFGKADGNVLSLGDGGYAILTFSKPVTNGPGPDFVVFENGFEDAANPGHYFLELAFVEVSSNGEHFIRFPSVSLTQVDSQMQAFGYVDPTEIYNLAGKYKINYGVPFDLEDIKDSIGIDMESITHIKIQDVVGCLLDDFANVDSRGNKINDPWPTAFNNGGFDLDAVGVINYNESTEVVEEMKAEFFPVLFPTYLNKGEEITIALGDEETFVNVTLLNITGMDRYSRDYTNCRKIQLTIPSEVTSGVNIMRITTPQHQWTYKILILE
ncbi:MAG: hypothetical protein JXB49_15025 [Bacteroidales bacterium]|nr:hypothetical protein [Bacteroidales bacterium]